MFLRGKVQCTCTFRIIRASKFSPWSHTKSDEWIVRYEQNWVRPGSGYMVNG